MKLWKLKKKIQNRQRIETMTTTDPKSVKMKWLNDWKEIKCKTWKRSQESEYVQSKGLNILYIYSYIALYWFSRYLFCFVLSNSCYVTYNQPKKQVQCFRFSSVRYFFFSSFHHSLCLTSVSNIVQFGCISFHSLF